MSNFNLSRKQVTSKILQNLKRSFARTKFTVKSDSFAGGDAVVIEWTDGPTEAQVKAVIGELAEFFTYQQYKRAYSPAARAVIAEQVKSLYEGLDVDDSQAVFDKLNCLPSVLIAKHGERITFQDEFIFTLERLKEEEKEREARLEKQHELERQLRKARRDVFSEDRAIAEQAEKDIKRLKEELWPYYEPRYNRAYGYMNNSLLSATD